MYNGCNRAFKKFMEFARKYPWLYPFTGLIALGWFIVRVVPKPSRALYPCQQIVTPIASGFVAWIIGSLAGLFPSIIAFKAGRKRLKSARFAAALVFFIAAMALYAGFLFVQSPIRLLSAADAPFVPEASNEPIGFGRGVKPGRVTWVHNPDAVNYTSSGNWWSESNLDKEVIDDMMSKTVRWLTGETTDTVAWDALFRNFNKERYNSDRGYQSGEKIAIKVNMNSSSSSVWSSGKKSFNTGPQTTNALITQLIEVVGVAGADITIYDASRCVGQPVMDQIRGNEGQDYQDVNFVINPEQPAEGFLLAVHDDSIPIVFADSTMQDYDQTYLPKCVTEATYLINFAVLKGHSLAGVTFCAKNFFGSVYHPSNTALKLGWTPNGTDTGSDGMYGIHYYMNPFKTSFWNKTSVREMGSYNALVDLMGHEHLGGKVMLCLVDGLYSSVNQGSDIKRWQSAPFNNDWTSSIFASQDFVAIESVCLDFLLAEPTMEYNKGSLDNYLHEGAQAHNPPSETFYDPEGDGTPLNSLGAHEHWNNAEDKLYSRNLGTGEGIELVRAPLAPKNFATFAGEGYVDLSWDACVFADSYIVKRSDTPEGDYTVIASGLTEPTYTDTDVTGGETWYYIVSAVNVYDESLNSDEVSATPDIPVDVEENPVEFELSLDTYPNPFNSSIRLSYTIEEDSRIRLQIFNMLGQRVATLVNTHMNTGNHTVVWNGRDDTGVLMSSGIYLLHLNSEKGSITKKIVLLY